MSYPFCKDTLSFDALLFVFLANLFRLKCFVILIPAIISPVAFFAYQNFFIFYLSSITPFFAVSYLYM
jgi:hypothetical protein